MDNLKTNLQNIEYLVTAGRLAAAIDKLVLFTKSTIQNIDNNELYRHILMVSSKYHSNESEHVMGLIADESYYKERSKITKIILDLIHKVEQHVYADFAKNENENKKQLNAIIIDDENESILVLERIVELFCPEINIIDSANSVKDAVKIIYNKRPDLVFLDIMMNNENGYELLDFFDEISFHVIFVTGFDKYAIEAFSMSAISYLLKPVDPDLLIQSISRLKGQMSNEYRYDVFKRNLNSSNKKIGIRTKDDIIFTEVAEIEFLQEIEGTVEVHFPGNRRLKSNDNFDHFSKLLNSTNFIHLSKSRIINIIILNDFEDSEEIQYIPLKSGHVININKEDLKIIKKNRPITARNDKHPPNHLASKSRQFLPHLMGNVMGSVINMIHNNENENAINTIRGFTHLFNTLTKDENEVLWTIEEELLFIKQYIKIKKINHGVNLKIFVEDCIERTFLVPKLVLHSFVTNSVKHNTSTNTIPINIILSIEKINENFKIEICDDGTGMPFNKKNKNGGIELVTDTVAEMNKVFIKKTNFFIDNAFPTKEKNQGVKVIFTIPDRYDLI